MLDLSVAMRGPSESVVAAWRHAAAEVGCFGLVNHGIPHSALVACLDAAVSFHTQDLEWKQRHSMSRSLGNKGYLPDEIGAGHGRDAAHHHVRDYATIDFGPELVNDPSAVQSILLGPNLWPELPGFRSAVTTYYEAINKVSVAASELLSRACGLDRHHLADRSGRGCSLLRLLHYPEPSWDPDQPPDGHTDYEWFTVIWQSSPGLEILARDGSTRVAPDRADVLVLILGDLLEVLTGGVLESTLHWVRPAERHRYSLTYFFGPNYEEVIAPLPMEGSAGFDAYPILGAGEHLTGLRIRHFPHLRQAVEAGAINVPFELPQANPLKLAKVARLASRRGPSAR